MVCISGQDNNGVLRHPHLWLRVIPHKGAVSHGGDSSTVEILNPSVHLGRVGCLVRGLLGK